MFGMVYSCSLSAAHAVCGNIKEGVQDCMTRMTFHPSAV